MHHKIILLALRMLCKGCYRLSIVLGFSFGQAKTIQIRVMQMTFFYENREKNPHFRKYSDTCGHGVGVKVSCITSVDGIKLWFKVHDF